MQRTLPNTIIIGAGKCGTTSLHYYLDLHPGITMAREKELHFFSHPEAWRRGLDWYSSNFDPHATIRGEASVTYTAWPKWSGVPERMASVVPDAKLLYIVRDPIERILSSWVHRYADGIESRPIREALETLEGNDLVERSRYHMQLTRYLDWYPQSRIHVICTERMRTDRRAVLSEIFSFLGVDPTFDTTRFDRLQHESRHKRRKGVMGKALSRVARSRPARLFSPTTRRRIGHWLYRPFTTTFQPPSLDQQTRDRLVAFLEPDVARLRVLTGHSFAEWSF